MALTSASVSPDTRERGESEVSLARLYLLRAMFLVWVLAGFFLASTLIR